MMNGGPISWKSRRQDNVSLSTSEAEFVAARQAGQEAICLCETLAEMDFFKLNQSLPTRGACGMGVVVFSKANCVMFPVPLYSEVNLIKKMVLSYILPTNEVRGNLWDFVGTGRWCATHCARNTSE